MGLGEPVRYQTSFTDSARWDGFVFRPGDIVISTPAKCGTTWLQMICALEIFKSATFDRPLDQISRLVCRLVTSRLLDPQRPARIEVVNMQLMIRGSTAAPAMEAVR